MGPAIAFEAATKTYDDGTHALGPLDLTVAAGELVAVVGLSGCGKSTLLRVASALTPATTGAVTTTGTVGYVFQDATLLPWRTVRRNVELLGELHGVGKQVRRAEADRALATVGLTDRADAYPHALSGGMKMRASLARTLTTRPSVFLFDEPFGALDEITRENLNDELGRLFDAERFAGLFVTHSIAEAVSMGTRVVVLSARPGRVVLDVAVPFGFPRTEDVRYGAPFARLCGDVHQALRGGHG